MYSYVCILFSIDCNKQSVQSVSSGRKKEFTNGNPPTAMVHIQPRLNFFQLYRYIPYVRYFNKFIVIPHIVPATLLMLCAFR